MNFVPQQLTVSADAVDTVAMQVEQALARIRTHRFIADAHNGRLSQDQATRWVMCAGRESRSFPQILKGMIERTPAGPMRTVLEENLHDELGGGNPEHAHFRHYVALLAQLGIEPAAFKAYQEGPGIRFALDLAKVMARTRRTAAALGYMLVNEGMTQITYAAAQAALCRHYDLPDLTFFKLHVEIDEEHVALLYEGLATVPGLVVRDVIYGVELGERGMAVLLDEAWGLFD